MSAHLRDVNETLKREMTAAGIVPPEGLPLSRKAQRRAEKLAKSIRQDIRAVATQWSHAIEEALLSSLALDGRVTTARMPDGTTCSVRWEPKAASVVRKA